MSDNFEQRQEAGQVLELPVIEAVLFDMDGVVTATAVAHAAVWKRLFDEYLKAHAARRNEAFRSFDAERDYRKYVDGKPRYDGVRSFLASREIELPYGSEDDSPEEETICGLGNRKNGYFHSWLKENPVDIFPGTLAFIDALKHEKIKVAVFSSSRNAEAVLHNAGILDRFDVKVDGNDMSELQLPGKPSPAILNEAAARLEVPPEHCAVLEDSIAGIAAGEAGAFGLVIGVDREAQAQQLAKAGADLVIGDLAELLVQEGGRLDVKTVDNLPSAWACKEVIGKRIEGKSIAVFVDYDGTLTPIVDDPTKANLDEAMRATVSELARKVTVAIVSGRDLKDLRKRVGLDFVFMAGSHGFEVSGPEGWRETLEKGTEYLPDLSDAEGALKERLKVIEGAAVERKRFSIAVHYRRVRDEDVGRVKDSVDQVLAQQPCLHKGEGKRVFRLQPRIDWDKGKALGWILDQLDLNHGDVVPMYIGDDVTDEDAFRALSGRGIAIVVRDGDRRTAADYALESPADVCRFLQMLITLGPRSR